MKFTRDRKYKVGFLFFNRNGREEYFAPIAVKFSRTILIKHFDKMLSPERMQPI